MKETPGNEGDPFPERTRAIAVFETLKRIHPNADGAPLTTVQMESLLDFLVLPWGGTPAPEPPKIECDVFGGTLGGMKTIEVALREPFFIRLLHNKQLGYTEQRVHLGATHSRLAHLVGTVELTNAFITKINEILDRRDDIGAPKNLPKKLSHEEEFAVLLFAFLHDCIPLPFGHSMELVRDPFVADSPDKRKLDKILLERHLGELWSSPKAAHESPLPKVILRIIGQAHTVEEASNIIKYLQFLAIPHSEARKAFPDLWETRFFLRQIFDSPIDVDRLDWISRDCYHLGEAIGLHAKWQRLLDALNLRVLPEPQSDLLKKMESELGRRRMGTESPSWFSSAASNP